MEHLAKIAEGRTAAEFGTELARMGESPSSCKYLTAVVYWAGEPVTVQTPSRNWVSQTEGD